MPQAPRIELHPVSQRVQVHVDGKLLADSTQVLELRVQGYPPRHYFPLGDVWMYFLTTSETTTHCPFKGNTVYLSRARFFCFHTARTPSGHADESGMLIQPCYAAGTIINIMLPTYI